MALSAQFIADFSTFNTAVDTALVRLRAFDQGAAKVAQSLSRMVDQFSGRKLIQDATLMAEVFQRAGGATAFTTNELKRMGATATEAIAKLGTAAVPAKLQAVATAAKAVADAEKLAADQAAALADKLRLLDQFSGRKVIQDATQIADMFRTAGGAARFTANELRAMAQVTDEAGRKMIALGTATTRLPPEFAALSAAAKAANTEVATFDQQMRKIASAAMTVGAGLTAGLTVPIVTTGKAALTASMDYESAMAGVRRTVDATANDPNLDHLSAQFRQMSKELPKSAVEIANIGMQAGQLGVHTPQVAAFTKTIIDISTATSLTADEAGASFARIANVMKMPQDQFDRMGSAVYVLGKNGAATEREILDLAQRISAAGGAAGFSVPQILGIANALSSVGIEAEAGGTAISRVILRMAQDVASGGGKLDVFAKVSSKTAQQFATDWRQNAGQAFVDFMQGLSDSRARGGDEFLGLIKELGFDVNVRLVNAFVSAANAGKLLPESVRLGTEAFKDGTALVEGAAKVYDTTASRLKILQNTWADVSRTLGDAFKPLVNIAVPYVVAFAGKVEDLAATFATLPTEAKVAAAGVVGFAAVLGPALVTIGGLAFTISQVHGVLLLFPGAATAAADALIAMGGAAGILTGAFALIVVPVAIYELVRLYQQLKGLHDDMRGWKRDDQGVADTFANTIAIAEQQSGQKFGKDHAAALAWLTENAKKLRAASVDTLGPLQGMKLTIASLVPAATAAGAATQTLLEKVAALTAEQEASIRAGVASGLNTKQIAETYKLGADVIAVYLRQQRLETAEHREANAALKRRQEAWKEYNAVVGGIHDQLSADVIEAIKWDLRRNDSLGQVADKQAVLAQVYEVSAAQISGVNDLMKQEDAAAIALATNLNKLADAARKSAEESRKIENARGVALLKEEEKNYGDRLAAKTTYEDMVARRSLSSYEYQQDQIRQHLAEQKRTLETSGGDWAAAYAYYEQTANQAIDEIAWEQLQADIDAADAWTEKFAQDGEKALGELAQAFATLAQISGGALGSMMTGIGQFIGLLNTMKSDTKGGTLNQIFGRDPNNPAGGGTDIFAPGHRFGQPTSSAGKAGFAGAQIGAGMLANATANYTTKSGQVAHYAATGAQYGAIAGPWGMAVGAGVGALVGAFKVSPVELAARKTYAEWQTKIVAAFDATASAELRAEAGGETWKKTIIQVREAYRAEGKTAEQALADIARAQDTADGNTQAAARALARINAVLEEQARQADIVTAAVQEYGLTWRDLDAAAQGRDVSARMAQLIEQHDLLVKKGYTEEAVIKGMSGAMNEFLVDAVRTNTQIPASMQPMIDQMIEMGLVTEDAARALLKLGEDGMPSLADITAAADRYGLTLDQLGPKVNQLSINEQATQVIADFKLLGEAGVDAGIVIGAMSEKAQALVTQALTFGSTLPEGMRPILETMAAAGELTDESGDKMNDLSRLTFVRPVTEMFDTLIAKVGELVDVLKTQLQPALAGLGDVQVGTSPTTDIPGAGLTIVPALSMAEGGYGRVTRPTLFYSKGAEDYAFSGEGKRFNAERGESTTIVVQTYLDGQVVAETTIPHLARALRLRGVAA